MTVLVTVTELAPVTVGVIDPPPVTVEVGDPPLVSVAVSETVIDVTASGLAGSLSTVAAAADVDMAGAITGSLLVYNATTQRFSASGALDGLTLDGGTY